MATGTVYLVGAGPGNPELLTLKAARLLGEADLIAYDDLIDPGMLALARADATLLPVGYRGVHGGGKAPPPIHPSILAAAARGQMVVRLKCGDPMVFGRGGDEAMILRQHGVPYEIVPGVTAALGAAAYAGIPLTHRHMASGFRIVTAHTAATPPMSPPLPTVVDDQTLVLYMARRHLAAYCQDLLRGGHPADLPAAFIVSATTPAQRVLVGTLADLPGQVAADASDGPGLAIIGATVALRRDLAWFDEHLPLAGHRVLVARARAAPSQLAARLRSLGADVVETPLVRAQPLAAYGALDQMIQRLADYDALAFACAEGVAAFFARLAALGLDARELPHLPVIAIGEQASQRLATTGWQVATTLPGGCAEAVAAHAQVFRDRRVLLITATGGRPNLVRALSDQGAAVTTAAAYRQVHHFVRVASPPPELIILPSSSAARTILGADLGFDPRTTPMVVPGELTERAARSAGALTVHRAAHDSLDEMVALASRLLRGEVTGPYRPAVLDAAASVPGFLQEGAP